MTAASLSLTRPTLILNRNWQPITVSTVARALVKVFSGAARVVDPSDFQLYSWEDWSAQRPRDGELFIQAGRVRLRVPEVVTLTRYDRLPRQAVTFSRRNLFKRDHFTCQYCGAQPGGGELTIDHVIPRSQGGVTSWSNCVLACVRELQLTQGGSDSGPSRFPVETQTGSTGLASILCLARGSHRKLVEVPQRGVLERRAENVNEEISRTKFQEPKHGTVILRFGIWNLGFPNWR